jgi:hypothetical protein
MLVVRGCRRQVIHSMLTGVRDQQRRGPVDPARPRLPGHRRRPDHRPVPHPAGPAAPDTRSRAQLTSPGPPGRSGSGKPTSPASIPRRITPPAAITRSNHEPACTCHQPSHTPQLDSKFKIPAGKDNLPWLPSRPTAMRECQPSGGAASMALPPGPQLALQARGQLDAVASARSYAELSPISDAAPEPLANPSAPTRFWQLDGLF